jgi:hypothetical protein
LADPAFMSLRDEALQLSLEAPVGWSRSSSEVFPLQLLAPSDDGFRASCNFSHEHFDPPTPEGLATFVTRTKQAQRSDYEGFEEIEVAEVVIDNRPGTVQQYGWTPAAVGRPLTQVLALFVVEEGLLLEVDAATLADHAPRLLPVFGRILRSIRFL